MVGHSLDPLRKGLWPLAPIYGFGAWLRDLSFRAGWRERVGLSVPVLSVGNLTVGGTGKTPMVCWLVARAQRLGLRPGVLARGYGRAPGEPLNDEGRLLQRRFPGMLQEQDPDRVAAGQALVRRGAQVVIVDDGFQHRRLRRDVDLVCMDAARPAGRGGFLPSGDLRESVRALRRADVVVLTRAGAIDQAAFERRVQWVHQRAGRPIPVLAADHVLGEVVRRPANRTVPAADLAGQRVHLLSGIARPEAFAETAQELGVEIVGHDRFADHHQFSERDLTAVRQRASAANAVVMTTEKDDARLPETGFERLVVRIDLGFITGEPDPETLGWRR